MVASFAAWPERDAAGAVWELAIVLPIDVVLCINARKAANNAPGSRGDAFTAELEACVIRSPAAREHVQIA